MCGILGWLSGGSRALDHGRAERALDSLSHRGPDARGVWQDAAAGVVGCARMGAEFVFRPSPALPVPAGMHTLPKSGVRFAKWVPEQ